MRSINKKSLIALLAAALLLVSTVGVAVAYFSAIDAAKGDATLNLKGETVIDEGDSDTEKNVTIENVGETDVVVRVKAFGPAQLELTIDESKWVKGDGDYYYYKGILKPGDKTAADTFKASLTLSEKEAAELGTEFTVTVVQECSVVYDSAESLDNSAGWELPFSLGDLE